MQDESKKYQSKMQSITSLDNQDEQSLIKKVSGSCKNKISRWIRADIKLNISEVERSLKEYEKIELATKVKNRQKIRQTFYKDQIIKIQN